MRGRALSWCAAECSQLMYMAMALHQLLHDAMLNEVSCCEQAWRIVRCALLLCLDGSVLRCLVIGHSISNSIVGASPAPILNQRRRSSLKSSVQIAVPEQRVAVFRDTGHTESG